MKRVSITLLAAMGLFAVTATSAAAQDIFNPYGKPLHEIKRQYHHFCNNALIQWDDEAAAYKLCGKVHWYLESLKKKKKKKYRRKRRKKR